MEPKPFLDAFQDLNRQVLKLLDSLSALTALSDLEPGSYSEPELLRAVLRILLENQDIERCSIALLQDGRLTNAAGLDWNDVHPDAEPQLSGGAKCPAFELGEGILGQAALTGQLQRSENCAADPRFASGKGLVDNASGSLICIPVRAAGEVIGVLSVFHPDSGYFTHNHERFLALFANFAGQILSNVRYMQRLEEAITDRTRQLETALSRAEKLRDRFEQLSFVDELTGLHNRRFFFPEAQTSLARALRHEHSFSVLIIDLDHFKKINDRYGHDGGDVVLTQTGELLKQQTREGDILARFGGEEFVLALPNTGSIGACLLANRILSVIREAQWDGIDTHARVTASIGVACLEDHSRRFGEDLLERLLQRADRALYTSKAAGRDRYTLLAPDAAAG